MTTSKTKSKKSKKQKAILPSGTPSGIPYHCHTCKAENCKLWRPTCNSTPLICLSCLESKGHKVNLNESDQVWDEEIEGTSWIPAVPDIDGSWWNYTSVPIWWVNWWESLPTHKNNCLVCCGSGKNEKYTCFKCNGTGNRNLP